MNQQKPKTIYPHLARWTGVITGLGAFIGLFAMVLLVAGGLAEVGAGASALVAGWVPGRQHLPHSAIVTRVIRGVELLLLAPVAYLVLIALGKYLQPPNAGARAHLAHAELLGVKAFVAGLLFALLATNAVGRALDSQLELESAIASCLLMAAVGTYFFLLQRLAIRERGENT
jgi:hypothetical protein